MMKIFFIILLVVLALILIMVVKALRFKSPEKVIPTPEVTKVDFDSAVTKLQRLIKVPTVSKYNGIGEDEEPFKELVDMLPELFPRVCETCSFERIGRRGILYHWKGKNHDTASVFMAHYDVVPADSSQWEVPPFSGEIIDGVMWGRGTLDTKCTFCATLETANTLIAEGFVPDHDIYLAFSGEEEPHGPSADEIAQHINSTGVELKFVLDEGGAVIEHLFSQNAGRIAVVGIGEKGQLDARLTIKGQGGHSSQPPAHTLVGRLAKAISNIEDSPMEMHFNEPFTKLLKTIGPEGPFKVRFLLANIGVFKPIVDKITKKTGGEVNALIRTTFAFTELEGSDTINVMPSKVSCGLNVRCLKEDDKDKIVNHLKAASKEPDLEVEVMHYGPGSNYSRTDVPCYDLLKDAIMQTWQDATVTPYLMIAGSDSRHYSKFSDRVYRFCPMNLTAEERKMIHGNNERIRLDEWRNTLDFYYRIMKKM